MCVGSFCLVEYSGCLLQNFGCCTTRFTVVHLGVSSTQIRVKFCVQLQKFVLAQCVRPARRGVTLAAQHFSLTNQLGM